MSSVINLRRVRKQREREAKKATAAERRATFGRTRDEKERDDGEGAKLNAKLDAHRIDRSQ
ncbi:DUF4169 family protein [Acuticoccus kalidii]|uniref:DUF4169 family protein n=1 Tax=Acuticoccus kalidii TaxID=2910977 RepID=UPI0034E2C4C2